MSCSFCYELTVMLMFGRKVTLYIQSCIIKERNLICFCCLLSVVHTRTHTHAFFLHFREVSLLSLSKLQLCPQDLLSLTQGISHWADLRSQGL